MKKILFTIMMLLGAMGANAQFTVYQPAEVPLYAQGGRDGGAVRPGRAFLPGGPGDRQISFPPGRPGNGRLPRRHHGVTGGRALFRLKRI